MDNYSKIGESECVLSFILPIYNVAEWLPDCLESLLAQDIPHTNYEIICVNDGSPDNSREIILEYAAKNPNVRLIDKPNGGVSSARNAGIDAARGKYIWFVDPDDKVRPNILGKMFAKATDEDVVYFVFEYIEENDFGLKPSLDELSFSDYPQIADGNKLCKYESDGMARVSVWTCVAKRSFLMQYGIKFDERLTFVEDAYYKFLLESHCETPLYIDDALYFYRVRKSSAINKRNRDFTIKYTDSARLLASLFNDYLENQIDETSVFYSKCVNKALQSKEYALWSILRLSKDDFRLQLSKLKEAKLYPYKFRKENFNLKQFTNLKSKILALIKFPLPIEIYARFIAFVFRHTNLQY